MSRLVLFMLVGCTANQLITPTIWFEGAMNRICARVLSTSYWYLQGQSVLFMCTFSRIHIFFHRTFKDLLHCLSVSEMCCPPDWHRTNWSNVNQGDRFLNKPFDDVKVLIFLWWHPYMVTVTYSLIVLKIMKWHFLSKYASTSRPHHFSPSGLCLHIVVHYTLKILQN